MSLIYLSLNRPIDLNVATYFKQKHEAPTVQSLARLPALNPNIYSTH